jgi:hypothetical protein
MGDAEQMRHGAPSPQLDTGRTINITTWGVRSCPREATGRAPASAEKAGVIEIEFAAGGRMRILGIRTSLRPHCELPRGNGLARPETGAVILATLAYSGRQRSRYLASPIAKATESQRLFRRRQETGIAQDCVVGLAGLKPTANRLWA